MSESNTAPRFRPTLRDLEMLFSLSQARYLTADALEWLHFPTWRTRWTAWNEKHTAGDPARYLPSAQLYSRLRSMEALRLIYRLKRPTMLAVTTFRREPDLFFLGERGATLLANHWGLELETLHYGTPRERSYALLPHQAAVGRAYAALRSRIEEKPGLEFTDWRSEHDFQRDHDRINVFVPQGEDGSYHEQGIQPDGAFFIGHEGGRALFFVEVERDQPIRKWKRKVWAYEAYHGSAALRERFEHATFALLGVAETRTQQRNLLQATAEALVTLYPYNVERREAAMRRYEITTVERLHPATVGAGWLRLTAVRPVERRALGDRLRYGAEIETGEHVLIK